MHILVTGAAGFIGAHVSKALLENGHTVTGVDSFEDYYDPKLKTARLEQLVPAENFEFLRADLADRDATESIFSSRKFDRVIHLAAQAGVRYSLENPHVYAASNLNGFLNILEACRAAKTPHLLFASSSSVYGANAKQPYSTAQSTEHPLSLYAATKKANEMMAHSYAHLYRLPVTGLRFFTVYGPWGRPDMAYWSFTKKVLAGETIDVFNNGHHKRDFTYIDDAVRSVVGLVNKISESDENWDALDPDPARSAAPYRIFNIGNSQPVPLLDFIAAIEKATGKTAIKNMLPMQPGDVESTSADVGALQETIGFAPDTSLQLGIDRFVAWYRDYHAV